MQTKPFRSISEYYAQRFGEKVYRIPLQIAADCPKAKNLERCVFCDQWGSAAHSETAKMSLCEQVAHLKPLLKRRYKANKFLLYLQAYTTTVLEPKEVLDTLLELQDIETVGIVIGSRPDTLSGEWIDAIEDYAKDQYASVEIGAQSFLQENLDFLNRGHSVAATLAAIEKLNQSGLIDIGLHLILGLPNETDSEIISLAKKVSALNVHSLKIHNLHVLDNTQLAQLWRKKQIAIIDREEYIRRVILFLRHLTPETYIQRLFAVASRWQEVLAPDWVKKKLENSQRLIDTMNRLGHRQGDLFCR
jgi:radical SAM protein (TIGR01212 family)